LAIGKAGAINAGLIAASVVALSRPDIEAKLISWRDRQTAEVAEEPVDEG
ncbi:MAG TPA: 5-(carboxyamino)imidazole ribonucleotide mutase, partial [Rhodospirillum rubrum]|nr:5-(carboxyamino)imidazole ribonucleotide mutase [Rhodospirillum rubrum]